MTPFAPHRLWLQSLGLLAPLLLSACAVGLVPPAVDTTRFTPLPAQQRVIQEPTVKVLPRADGHEYCARITGHPITPTSRPMACAYWNTRRQECTVGLFRKLSQIVDHSRQSLSHVPHILLIL